MPHATPSTADRPGPAAQVSARGILCRLYVAALWSVPLSGMIVFVFARSVMGPAVAALVAWHIVGGLGLSIPFLIGLRGGAVPVTRPDVRRAVAVSAVLTFGSGLALVVWAAYGRSVGKLSIVFTAHIAAGVVVAFLACALCVRTARCWQRIVRSRMRLSASAATALALLLLTAGALGAYTYDAEGYYRALTASTPADAGNPRFPAGTLIERAAEWRRAPGAESCARVGCHPATERSWRVSAHAAAAAGPYYGAALRYAAQHIGREGIRWCEGCHSPLAAAAAGERGVGCLSCHSMRQVPLPSGNGIAIYAPPAAYPFDDASGGVARAIHDFLVRVRPGPHQVSMAGPPDRGHTASMCQPCHRLSVNAPQNHYKYVRYDSTYSDWRQSPYSGESAHAFGPAQPHRSCADCHLPPGRGSDITGSFHDHSCTGVAASSSKPGATGLKVEVFAVRRAGAEPGSAERIDAPLRSRPVVVRAGESVWADVLVETAGIGHAFPTGVPDLRDVRLEFGIEGQDERGVATRQVSYAAPHRYGLAALDRDGQALYRGNVYDMVGQAYRFPEGNAHGRALRYREVLPGIGDVARFRVHVPPSGVRRLTLVARVHYRPYNAGFARWVSLVTPGADAARLAHPPTWVLAEDRATIGVRDPGRPARVPSPQYGRQRDDPRDAPRLLAYGAALLMESDVPRARRAFQEAVSLAPASADAWVALGRAFLEEGDLLAARAKLEHALEIDARNAHAGVWLGRTYRLMGRYNLALRALEPLAKRYPVDSLIWLDIGLSRLQSGRPEEAIPAFERMLDVDPDDPVAHLNLMQCYRWLLRISDARREEVIYRTLQDTDPPAPVMDAYMRAHPEWRLEAQPIHEHLLKATK